MVADEAYGIQNLYGGLGHDQGPACCCAGSAAGPPGVSAWPMTACARGCRGGGEPPRGVRGPSLRRVCSGGRTGPRHGRALLTSGLTRTQWRLSSDDGVPSTIGKSLPRAVEFWATLWALCSASASPAPCRPSCPGRRCSGSWATTAPHDRQGRLLRMVSSSCSYAASALAKSLFARGADFTAAMAFMFASTNLVLELGIVLWLLLGWQFALAEFVGGAMMIASWRAGPAPRGRRRLSSRRRASPARRQGQRRPRGHGDEQRRSARRERIRTGPAGPTPPATRSAT